MLICKSACDRIFPLPQKQEHRTHEVTWLWWDVLKINFKLFIWNFLILIINVNLLYFGLNHRMKSPACWPSQVFWGRTWSVRSSAQLPTSWRRIRAPPSTWPSTVSTAVHTPSYILSFSSLVTETETEPSNGNENWKSETANPKYLDDKIDSTNTTCWGEFVQLLFLKTFLLNHLNDPNRQNTWETSDLVTSDQ